MRWARYSRGDIDRIRAEVQAKQDAHNQAEKETAKEADAGPKVETKTDRLN